MHVIAFFPAVSNDSSQRIIFRQYKKNIFSVSKEIHCEQIDSDNRKYRNELAVYDDIKIFRFRKKEFSAFGMSLFCKVLPDFVVIFLYAKKGECTDMNWLQ